VRFGGVHTFSYNSAEHEPIWMKSGALWVHCQRLALADFGRDLCSSDSWRDRLNFVFLSGKQHRRGGRLPWLSTITPLAGTKRYCLVTEAHRCQQLAQGCYAALHWAGIEPTTCWSQVRRSTRCATARDTKPRQMQLVQISERFESNTVLWAFHTIQPSSYSYTHVYIFW